jgi:uncharacterized membrane protein YgdD (TMEM256/DUF423 family)
MRGFAIIAAVFGALGVALGAFGAHALRGQLDDAALQIWRTAVDYQFWHALVLLLVAVYGRLSRASIVAAAAFSIGIVCFSGSLYALALGAPRSVGIVTPLGGVALIVGWLSAAWSFWQDRRMR